MTTKRRLAEQILRRLSGGDASDDSQYDIREIMLFVGQALGFLVKANYLENLRYGDTSIGSQYISTFPGVPVQFNKTTGKAFIDLPCTYLDLPDGRGIFHISPLRQQDNAFVPVRNGSETLFSHSAAGNLEGRIGFWAEGNRVYFNKDISREGCNEVLLKLAVVSPESIGADDPYPISSDMEIVVIGKVLEIMGIRVENDDANDNNDQP